MGERIDILALDLATTTGFARGAPGSMPVCGFIDFAPHGASENAVFGNALTWLSGYLLVHPRPTSIILEAMLPPEALKGATSRATRDRLAGLHGIVRSVAHCRGVYEISTVSVQSVRQHFCGNRLAKKDAVLERCRILGWDVKANHNAADAAATWHFACSLIDPKLALQVTPLFYGKRPMRISA